MVATGLQQNGRMRNLIIALLEAAATQEATLGELERACGYALEIAKNEMSQSNVCVTPFARRGITKLETV